MQHVRRSVVAVATGVAVDTLGTILVIVFVLFAYGAWGGAEQSNDTVRFVSWLPFQVFTFALGIFYTGFGGFVAARMVETRKILHALAVAAVSVFIALITDRAATPIWPLYAGCILSFPAAAAGGVLAERKRGQTRA